MGGSSGSDSGGESEPPKSNNPQQIINEFLSKPSSESKRKEDTETSLHDVRPDDGFDYERQDYSPIPMMPTNIRPSTAYIPQYSIEGNTHFPIQEVVPNSQMAISTGTSAGVPQAGENSWFRQRGQTITSNAFRDGEQSTRDQGTNLGNQNSNNGENGENPDDENDQGGENMPDPRNVPMMVKPKTLYQNPQTPTVLPSTYHPINKWSNVKHSYLKEFLAEFMGTMVLIIFGTAVNCQVNLGGKIQQDQYNAALQQLRNAGTIDDNMLVAFQSLEYLVSSVSAGTFDDVALGWAAAVAMGYFASGGSAISGAHLNPSVTIANFIFRGFPKAKIPYYLAGQLLGAFVGALITFIYYKKVITTAYPEWWTEQSVAGLFCVFPKDYLSSSRQFVSEFVTTAMFQAGILSITDPYTCLSSDVFPLMLFILIFIINAAMSYQTGSAINMARDLGPRLALYAVGFNKHVLWINHRHFFWVPMVAPFLGSTTGALVYDICIYQGHESPVNWPLAVYKEMILRMWHRRPGWKNRNRGRATSNLSDFSYEDDEELADAADSKAGDGKVDSKSLNRKRTNSSESDIDDGPKQKSVQFKSLGRAKRGYGGVPTILEEEGSIEASSLGDVGSDSILVSDDGSGMNYETDENSAYSKKLG